MASPMEYGARVQDALRALIEERFLEDSSPVRNKAELSRALGHGNAKQYVASRFTPDSKSGKVRDLTVPDLLAFAAALGLDGSDLLARARRRADGAEPGKRTPLGGPKDEPVLKVRTPKKGK